MEEYGQRMQEEHIAKVTVLEEQVLEAFDMRELGEAAHLLSKIRLASLLFRGDYEEAEDLSEVKKDSRYEATPRCKPERSSIYLLATGEKRRRRGALQAAPWRRGTEEGQVRSGAAPRGSAHPEATVSIRTAGS